MTTRLHFFNFLGAIAILLLSMQTQAQSYCNDFQGVLNPTTTAQTVSSTGGYYEFAATTGCEYVFSHCNNGGSYTGDTYFRITDGTNALLASNDDFCGLGSQVTWTATITATVRIHLGTCCGGTGGSPIACAGGPTRVMAYLSTNCNPCPGVNAPTVAPVAAVCDSGSFTVNATSAGTIHWFATSNTSGTPLSTSNPYVTPIINSTTTYFAATFNSGSNCYSAATPVECVVVPPPAVNLFSQLTIFCNNDAPQDLISLPAGGVLTGSGAVNNQFDPAVAGVGSHVITYTITDTNGCTNVDSLTMDVQSPVTDAIVFTCPNEIFPLTGFDANSVWFSSASSNTPLDTGMVYNAGPVTSDTTYYYGDLQPQKQFTIDSISGTITVISDHNGSSGDDRGGIAVTPDYVYYVGDGNTARANAADLTNWVSLPQRDGIFSDLQTGQLYTLWDSTQGPQGTFINNYILSGLAPMDADLNIDAVNVIPLSQNITLTNGADCGIFAGYGILIVWSAADFKYYKIDIATGTVSDLGVGTLNAYASENWAIWGVAEYIGDDYYVTYRVNGGNDIERLNISTGVTSTLVSFPSSINDLACFTFSPWNNNWYFHHENASAQFGGGTENVGFTASGFTFNPDAITLGCRTTVPVELNPVPVPNLGNDQNICANEPFELDPGVFASYEWSTGATSQTIGTPTSGTYSVTVTNAEGCTGTDEVLMVVNPVVDVNLGADVTICNNATLILNAGGGYAAYEWNDQSTSSTLLVNGFSSPLGPNSYSVTATTFENCTTSDTITVTVDNCTGIEDVDGSGISVYPNPTTGIVFISFDNTSVDASVSVFDLSGKMVMDVALTGKSQSIEEVDMSTLPAGMYYLNVIADETTSTRKITLTK